MDVNEIHAALAAPFEEGILRFFPIAFSKDRTMAKVGAYVDARAVMDRLDAVVGPDGWCTSFRLLDEQAKAVECTLSLRYGDAWVTKADVGYPNQAQDALDADKEPLKAAFSDALKRAAVQHGVGRYIYNLQLARDWLPVDDHGRFREQPRVMSRPAPSSSLPPPPPAPAAAPAPAQLQEAVDQLGRFRDSAGQLDTRAVLRALNEMGLEHNHVLLVCENKGKFGPTIEHWLSQNPTLTVDDLLRKVASAYRDSVEGALV